MSDPVEVVVVALIGCGLFGAGWIAGAWFGLRLAMEAMRRGE